MKTPSFDGVFLFLLVVRMGYIVVALVSFLFGYALCFKWLGEDIIKGNLIKLNKDVYVASKVDTDAGGHHGSS